MSENIYVTQLILASMKRGQVHTCQWKQASAGVEASKFKTSFCRSIFGENWHWTLLTNCPVWFSSQKPVLRVHSQKTATRNVTLFVMNGQKWVTFQKYDSKKTVASDHNKALVVFCCSQFESGGEGEVFLSLKLDKANDKLTILVMTMRTILTKQSCLQSLYEIFRQCSHHGAFFWLWV